jgi:hypothetical protein
MHRLGLLALAPLLFLLPPASAGGDKEKPDQKKPDLKKPEIKKKPLPPPPLVATVVMKDGSTAQCIFLPTQLISIRGPDAGIIGLKVDAIRFVDFEGPAQRIGTHNLDTLYGVIQTAEFTVRIQAAGQTVTLPKGRLKRIVFPEQIRVLTLQ